MSKSWQFRLIALTIIVTFVGYAVLFSKPFEFSTITNFMVMTGAALGIIAGIRFTSLDFGEKKKDDPLGILDEKDR